MIYGSVPAISRLTILLALRTAGSRTMCDNLNWLRYSSTNIVHLINVYSINIIIIIFKIFSILG